MVDVWESREAFERFQQSRLVPAVQAVAQRNGLDAQAPQTEFQDIFDLLPGREPQIPGIAPCARLIAEGHGRAWHGGLAMINPDYELVAAGGE